MEVNINTGSEFKRQFKRLMKKYHSLLHDFDVWKQELKNNPFAGDDLGAGVRKIRMAINSKGKGKSGGARILTLNILLDAETMDITLLTIYDKGEISNVNELYQVSGRKLVKNFYFINGDNTPVTARRSHPAKHGEGFDAPPTL